MQGSTKIPITNLNEHITCKICSGYFIDATTIIECLHTFCRSCIVKYFKKNKYCPVCDVLVHKTKPLLNIRADKTVQNIVYKLVPRLFQNEMQQRRTFYENRPDCKPSSLEQCGEASYQYFLTAEESICLTLSYHGSDNKPRYLRCPAAVSVGHLKKLIRAKYDLTDNHKVDILYNQDCLNHNLTLIDIAYIYLWKRKGPMPLTYKIYEYTAKRIKLDHENDDTVQVNNNWKEVQLRISENGEMSITGIQDDRLSPSLLEIVNNDSKYKDDTEEGNAKTVSKNVTKKELPELKFIGKGSSTVESPSQSITNSTCTSTMSSKDKLKNECFAALPEESVIVSTNSNAITTVIDSNCTLNTTSNSVHNFSNSCSTLSCATTTTVYSTINNSMCSTKSEDLPVTNKVQKGTDEIGEASNESASGQSPGKNLKRKVELKLDSETPAKQPKQTILNHSIGLLNLSNNHPLKKHSKLNRNGENLKDASTKLPSSSENEVVTKTNNAVMKTVNTISTSEITISKLSSDNISAPDMPASISLIMSTRSSIIPAKTNAVSYSPAKAPCYMPKTNYQPIITVPKPTTSISQIPREVEPRLCSLVPSKLDNKQNNNTGSQQAVQNSTKPGIKMKPSTPIGYKTLRDPPRSWNSRISKANLCKSSPEQKPSDSKNVKPAKFFKMRNNIPRYLGNPASGVKPMYQVHGTPDQDKAQDVNKMERSEIKKHSIVKIDPKTLKPISEKAPEMTSLSNNIFTSQSLTSLNCTNQILSNPVCSSPKINIHSDLRINTSSVSIFSPLKLQSSPKNDRKSPKSPHSPKLKPTTSPTGSKREKVNLNFTPANPFIPNLASPTMSPNQFLYTNGPPGFPAYDPRVMAAYHSMWYPRMQFPSAIPGMNMNLEMLTSPSSPTMGALTQNAHNHQLPSRTASTTSSNTSTLSRKHGTVPSPAMTKLASSNRKNPREMKSEKSLQNAVEKLTQNRQKISTENESSASTALPIQKQPLVAINKPIDEPSNETDGNEKKQEQTSLEEARSLTVTSVLSTTKTSEKNDSVSVPSPKSQPKDNEDTNGEAVMTPQETCDDSQKPVDSLELPEKTQTVAAAENASTEAAQCNADSKENSQSNSTGTEEVADKTESVEQIEANVDEKNKEETSGSNNVRRNGDSDNGTGSEEITKEGK